MLKAKFMFARQHGVAAAPSRVIWPVMLTASLGAAHAAEWEVSGQVRQTIAIKTTNDQNQNNQYGNASNGAPDVDFSATGWSPGALNNGIVTPTRDLTRPASTAREARFNAFQTRLDLNVDGKLTDVLKATIRLRAVSEQLDNIDSTYKGNYAGSARNAGSFYRQSYGGTDGAPLAYAGKRNRLDLPAAYLDYGEGALWLRAGNQQIAWGEAIFFRVADVPNALDLRGHLLGPAAEEYSDTRRAALGVRGNYRLSDKSEVDAFVQRFTPTTLPNAETPYNAISDQFTVHDQEGWDRFRNKLNAGFRVKGDWRGLGLQGFVVNRIDPNGTYQWSDATGTTALPGTPFEADRSGVWNAGEWYQSAARMHLDATEGLAAAMNLTAQRLGGADPYNMSALAAACGTADPTYGSIRVGSAAAASCVLDSFFSSLGALRGHIVREYHRETVMGGGVNRVFEGEPDSLLDQLIGRFEFSYTPNKRFTNPTLGEPIKKDEYAFAFITEKYHKFSSDYPATYFVAQWLHKSQSDLFGRYLGTVTLPDGSRGVQQTGFNALALSVQQPSPTLAYRFDFTVLTDTRGGWYLQPGMKWKPRKDVQVDVYLNALYSQHKGEFKDFADGLQHSNELFARVAFTF